MVDKDQVYRSLKAKCEHVIEIAEPQLEKAKDIQRELDAVIYALNDSIVEVRHIKELIELLKKDD